MLAPPHHWRRPQNHRALGQVAQRFTSNGCPSRSVKSTESPARDRAPYTGARSPTWRGRKSMPCDQPTLDLASSNTGHQVLTPTVFL